MYMHAYIRTYVHIYIHTHTYTHSSWRHCLSKHLCSYSMTQFPRTLLQWVGRDREGHIIITNKCKEALDATPTAVDFKLELPVWPSCSLWCHRGCTAPTQSPCCRSISTQRDSRYDSHVITLSSHVITLSSRMITLSKYRINISSFPPIRNSVNKQ